MILWIIAIIFAILSGILLSGKGAFLVAGYNTSSAKEKAKYNAKRLSICMGIFMAMLTCMLIILACFGENAPRFVYIFFMVGVLLCVVGMIITTHTICLEKKSTSPTTPTSPTSIINSSTDEIPQEKKVNKVIAKVSIIFTAIIIIFASVMIFTGDTDISINSDTNEINIICNRYSDYSVGMNTITNISTITDLNVGYRTSGLKSFKLLGGYFKNDTYGNYILYSYVDCNTYIVLETTGKTIVINQETDDKTEDLFNDIKLYFGK